MFCVKRGVGMCCLDTDHIAELWFASMLLEETTRLVMRARYVLSINVLTKLCCGWKPQMFATGSKKVIFNQEVSENFVTNSAAGFFLLLVVLVVSALCWVLGGRSPPRPRFLRASWVQTSPPCTTMELLLNRPLERVGKFNEGGHKVICDVLCSLELLRHPPQEKSINHTVHPLWMDLNVTGPHAVVLNVSFHWWCGRVFGKPICKTSLCLRCEAFTDNLSCLTIWVMRLTMTYSRMCLSVSPQLPPALPWDWGNCGKLLYKWPSRQGGGRKDFWADGRTLPVNNWFILGHNTLDFFTQCPYHHFCTIHWWSSNTNWMNLC